ncbi:MAG: hypothetical protein HYX38_05210 [Rhodospirillales bacterium]|nr:hypothetical protein [Rhodospirillales bacterium]
MPALSGVGAQKPTTDVVAGNGRLPFPPALGRERLELLRKTARERTVLVVTHPEDLARRDPHA